MVDNTAITSSPVIEPLTLEKREPYTAQLNPAMCSETMKTLVGVVVAKEGTSESALIRHAVSVFLVNYFSNSGATPETAQAENS